MEVGRSDIAGKHHSKRLDAKVNKRGGKFASLEPAVRPWDDGIAAPPSSIAQLAQSALFNEGSIDKLLFQDMVEMIRLVESLMILIEDLSEKQTFPQDHHHNKQFPRHASLIYTPTPPRDPLMLKQAVEHKGKRGHTQFIRGKRAEVKDGFFWESAGNKYLDCQEGFLEEIPMLSFPMDHQEDQNAVNKNLIARLQGQIEQLEQKLQEKENQLYQAAEKSTLQDNLVCLQAKVEELQREMLSKEQETQQAFNRLSEKQREVASLQSLLQKAQADLDESNMNLTEVKAELDNLQCQVAYFILEVQRMSSSFDNHSSDLEQGLCLVAEAWPEEDGWIDCRIHRSHNNVEVTRRKYLACLIAAREIPTEEALSLVADFRAQLLDFLMET